MDYARLAALIGASRDLGEEATEALKKFEGRDLSTLTPAEHDELLKLHADRGDAEGFVAGLSYQASAGFDPRAGRSAGQAREDRAFEAGQGFRDLPGGTGSEPDALGRLLLAQRDGRPYEGRAAGSGQTELSGPTGAFLVPTPIAATVLDAAVARMRTAEMGARIVPMSSATLKQPTLETLPTLTWRGETQTIPESSAAFGTVTFTARAVGCIVRISQEAYEDVAGLDATVRDALATAFAVEFDRVGLYGAGTATEPKGLKPVMVGTAQETSLGTNGGSIDYGKLIAAKAAVKGRAFDPTGALLSTRTEAALGSLTDTTGQFMAPPAYLSDLPIRSSAALPTNLAKGSATTTADAFVGDWNFLAYGLRTAFTVRTLNERFADTGEVGLLAWARADVQVLRPAAFQVLTGATN